MTPRFHPQVSSLLIAWFRSYLTRPIVPEHEPCLLAETHEFAKFAENVRIHTRERLLSQFVEILGKDTLALQLVTQVDATLSKSNTDCLTELEHRALQEHPRSPTTARSKRRHSAKASRRQGRNKASRSMNQRPPFSSPAPIAPENSAAAQLSPPVSLRPYPVPSAHSQFHPPHVGQETRTSSPMFQRQIWSAYTPQATDSVARTPPHQDFALPGRRDQLIPSTQWVGNEHTRQSFQVGMQQGPSITQSTFPAAQPPPGDMYPSHQGQVFYPDPRQPNAPQAQGHGGTFPYETQPSEYYQSTTQGSFDNWQHMPGSDGSQREG